MDYILLHYYYFFWTLPLTHSFSCSLGYLFHVASQLGSAGGFAFDRIEDAIVQADEVDGRMLQFEGGLSITGNT